MAKQKVVVKGGGENLYYISESSGIFYVYKGSVWGSDTQIGKTRDKADAISLIRSHSGRDIERMD
jgi:hypothetical protein